APRKVLDGQLHDRLTGMIYVRGPFFFQAEDGIRDRNVTGVQTCALPISLSTIIFAWYSPKVLPLGFPVPGSLWKCLKVLGQNNCLLLLRAVSSYLPEEILSITLRVQTLLCSLALSSACFLSSSLARQAKPTPTPPQQPQQKSLPTGPLAAPHSTHYPILL